MPDIKVWDGFNREYVVSRVDDEDYEWASKRGWNLSERGYAYCKVGTYPKNQRSIYLHKAVLERVLGESSVHGKRGDHVNNDKLDNRRDNLRIATSSQNQHNRVKDKRNKSGFFGVSFSKSYRKWIAQGCINYKQTLIGVFDIKADAALAYDQWAITNRGEFARLNFPTVVYDNVDWT